MNRKEIIDLIRDNRAEEARLQAETMLALHVLDGTGSPDRSLPDELAVELGLSRVATRNLLCLARDLVTRMPRVLGLMETGHLSPLGATNIVSVVRPVSDEKAVEIDSVIADRVMDRSPTQARRIARDLVNRIDGKEAAKRAQQRRARRKVRLVHGQDATAKIQAELPAEVAAAVLARLEHTANELKKPDETRSIDQLQADVFRDALLGTHKGNPPVQPEVMIHVPLGVALTITDDACEVEGVGTVPAGVAREIMNNPDSVWRRVITDPESGEALSVDDTIYQPPSAPTGTVRRTCRFWACERPAQAGNADRRQRRSGGDKARRRNGFCKEHQHLGDLSGWHYKVDLRTRAVVITTATGEVVPGTPARPVPAFRSGAA